jgi:uncharacterized cupredoxin-like copper-binding protein
VLACSGGPARPAAASAELKEYSITLDQSTLAAGEVTFNVRNSGTVDHEFVVVDTETPAGQLPQANGEVTEDSLTVVDEIEDIVPGATPQLKVNLAAGHYVLICNIPGHYAGGMHADITVQ